ncbi:hypothetical protein PKHYL_07530 [Psychrobacter sp. KH172YL61]|nr:hypothetical protein PKHYL_07530 [Psychrobacter sp. KH172YL61]
MMANNMTDTATKLDNNTAKAEPNSNADRQSWFNRPIPGIKQQLTAQLTAVETEPSTKCSNCHSVITNTALIF